MHRLAQFVRPGLIGLLVAATGRMYNERLGKLHFWLMLPAFYVQSLGQMQTGLLGMRRRIVDYDPSLGVQPTQMLITIAGFVIALAVLIAIINSPPAPVRVW